MDPVDIVNRRVLAEFLGISHSALRMYLTQKPVVVVRGVFPVDRLLNRRAWLKKHLIPKRSKHGYRVVYEVRKASLQQAHKSIYSCLLASYVPQDCVHGFVSGRGIATNARVHLAKKSILNCDIANFFEMVTEQQIERVFIRLGFPAATSSDLAKLCILNGHLVQGYVVSPIIANLVASDMDAELTALVGVGASYTRYADDMTFSTDGELPQIEKIATIIEKYGFRLNPEKTHHMFRGEKQYVTGLTVFDNNCPRIPRRFKRRVRLLLYYMSKYGKLSFQLKMLGYTTKEYEYESDIQAMVEYEIEGEDKRLKGWIDYINSVEPQKSAVYYKQYNTINKIFRRNLPKILKIQVPQLYPRSSRGLK